MSHQKPKRPPANRPFGVPGFYLVAVMSMAVSVDTSWRFFEHNLHIADVANASSCSPSSKSR